jgi:hypothetical protein
MKSQKNIQSKFTELMKEESTHEFIAFSFSNKSNLEYYTIRDSISDANLEVINECVKVFGADFQTICQSLISLNIDLDKRYYPKQLFS